MTLKPWYKVVTPREDLREGKPLDASEFAVHLDQIRDKRAPEVYQDPKKFFERTYLTRNLTTFAGEVIRRLSGEKTETSAVFNLSTQFGGGKTHSLTLLYHLSKHGNKAMGWPGVLKIVEEAKIPEIPTAKTAIFVGSEFDSLVGRGGDDGTPLRKTPWGEIAYQLGKDEGLKIVEKHEKQMIAPAGDVIRKFLPKDKPCLILMDELMNYISRNRKSGLAAQLYNFVQNLSEEARGRDNVVFAVSIPASELEMNSEDQEDFSRLKKLLDRVGKACIMSAETETSEIIRRRLFEWEGLPKEANNTIVEYAEWVIDHREKLPHWFPVDNAREAFAATYPFHPILISVFERKWQALPRFQKTRGVLRLLALWVSKAYQDGFKGAHKDPLIGLGTAPLEDSTFRAAIFEQLNENRLEGAVTTDISGKKDANALRLDKESSEEMKSFRLHKKVATSILFESNGGQTRDVATVPEIRIAVAEPELNLGNIETTLENLTQNCYFLLVENNRYRFSVSPNLVKIHSDRMASVKSEHIQERLQTEIQAIFPSGLGVERVFFPEKSNHISDTPSLTFVVLSPDNSVEDEKTMKLIETMTKEHGTSARTFKSSLIWCVPENVGSLKDEARKLLAWEDIDSEKEQLKLDDTQRKQLPESLKKSKRDLKESIWRTYKNIMILDKDNNIKRIDLGLVHSSAAENIIKLILNELKRQGLLEEAISPNFVSRNWPPALKEWSTKSVKDAFFASPQFPRLINGEVIKNTVATGVTNGTFAYVGKTPDNKYKPFMFNETMGAIEVELSDDVFIIPNELAEEYKRSQKVPEVETGTDTEEDDIGTEGEGSTTPDDGTTSQPTPTQKPLYETVPKLKWEGEIPYQKYMTVYTKVLSSFAVDKGLKIKLNVEVTPEDGIAKYKIEEVKAALRDLGLNDDVETE